MSEPNSHYDGGDATEADTADVRRFPVGTLVFGLVLVAVGLIMLAGILYGLTLDPAVIAVGIVVGAGLLLIVGGLVAGRRSNHPHRSAA